MAELTPAQRIERARQAKMALDEFLAPAFAVVEADYTEKMVSVAATTDPRAPEIITRLANGVKVARQVRSLIETLVADGVEAKAALARGQKFEELSPAQQRLVSIGAH